MSTYNGVEGEWQVTRHAEEGDIIRYTGVWNDFEGEIGNEIRLDSSDVIEKFVPDVSVPTEPGLYRDVDGDLWYAFTDYGNDLKWQLAVGANGFETQQDGDDDDVAQFLPLTPIDLGD